MSIIGVTVGTTLSPQKIEEKINPVKSVNNQLPDENGNVDVEVNANITESDPTVPAWAKQPTKPSYSNSEVGLGNVDNVKQYSAENPPPYPVRSVNGKGGAVTLSASDVGARPSTWTPTYSEVGAEKSGTASTAISSHNTNTSAHNDLRLLIEGLTTRLNALANSTDNDLDQMAEVVAYIKANKQLIDSITTSKVSVADIVDNLSTNVTNRPLSAAQGVALKALIDAISVPTKVSELDNDAKYLTSFTESDPTVPSWAKQSTKPSYSKSEVGLGNVDNVKQYSASNPPPYPVTKVNNKTGAVTLSASDVGADPSGTASSAVSAHNSNTSAHADIRSQISKLSSEIADEVENQLDGAKADIVVALISQLGGMPVFGTVNSDKTITVTSMLADGVYMLMYTNADGNLEEVGTITVDNNEESYINLVRNATKANSTELYEGCGYKNNTYLSSSSGDPGDKSGYVTTGFIEHDGTPTFYIKGADWVTNDGSCRAMFYNSNYEKYSTDFYILGTATNNVTRTQDEGDDFIKVTFNANMTIVKQAPYIRMCLKGTGENLIISKTPIE